MSFSYFLLYTKACFTDDTVYCDNGKIYCEQETDTDEKIRNYRILEKTDNLMVINLPSDKNGKFVQGDVDNGPFAAV